MPAAKPVTVVFAWRVLDARYAKVFGPDDVTSAFDVVSPAGRPVAFFHAQVALAPYRTKTGRECTSFD